MNGHIEPKLPRPDHAGSTSDAASPDAAARATLGIPSNGAVPAAAEVGPELMTAILLDGEGDASESAETSDTISTSTGSAAPATPAAPTTNATGQDRSHETTAAGIPWLAFARYRTQVRERWELPWDMRIVDEMLESADDANIWSNVNSVLDVGATDRLHEPAIRRRRPDIDYRSLDVDRSLPHDYHDFADVDRTFDMVVCFEVLEHVDERTAVQLVRQCTSVLRPGGHLLISVPNLLVPYYQLEFTHCTAYRYDDLAALFSIHGAIVDEVVRCASGPRRSRWIHQHILGRWHRFMRTDFCSSIICLGHMPGPGEPAPIVPTP
ncbi:MAG: class I SAM-dependent methyltransferase [Phycisphaerales bacterium]